MWIWKQLLAGYIYAWYSLFIHLYFETDEGQSYIVVPQIFLHNLKLVNFAMDVNEVLPKSETLRLREKLIG